MHERVIVTGMKYDILIQMVVEQVLTEKSKESTKYIAHVTNIIWYISVNAAEPGYSSGKMP